MAPFQAVTYTDGDRALAGRLVRPKGEPRAAIAVFPTIMNPTAAVEAKARALAEAGYLAMICDFYGAAPGNLGKRTNGRTTCAPIRAPTAPGFTPRSLHCVKLRQICE